MASTLTITAASTIRGIETSRFNWVITDICMTHRFFTQTSADDGRVMGPNLHCATRSLTTRKSPLASYFNKETPRGKVEAPKSRVREICLRGDPKGATGQQKDSEKPFTTSVGRTTKVRSLNSNRAMHGISTRSLNLNNPYFVFAVVGRRPNRLERSIPRHTPSCLQELEKLGLRNLCTPTSWMSNYLN